MLFWIIIAAWCAVGLLAIRILQVHLERRHILGRVYSAESPQVAPEEGIEIQNVLRRWLSAAGFRSFAAPTVFLVSTLVLGATGIASAWLFRTSPLYFQGLRVLTNFPGGIGDIFLPIFYVGPWIVATILTCLPWLIVQRQRRLRVEAIEQDLPVTLELLATLSEAGLGFDSALARLLDSQPIERPLSRELRTFQLDTMSGRSRVDCFRRLAARVDVVPLSILVSAIVQAEQVGAGVSGVLRQQADDLRDRRRENAMALAMALPIKRLFPMMICFLPGIFVATLGPTFFQFFQYADTVLRLQTFGGIR